MMTISEDNINFVIENVLTSPRRRWFRIAEWLVVALLGIQMCVRTLPKAWQSLNTDFPNYYLTASLTREHYDTSRVYEWIWLQRQKDHRDIDQRIVGMVPITPFSTLMIYPLTAMPALVAKHCWIIINFIFLSSSLYILRVLTSLPWRRLFLVTVISFPIRVNILFGQYYILLLFLLTLSCWLYIRRRRFLTGLAVGIATGLKIFPGIYLFYFIRKKDWSALAGGVLAAIGTVIVSIAVLGWQLHRTYFFQVLPSVLRGEGLDPYNLKAASISSLLHHLFIYEPLLNQHPAVNAPWLFVVLLAVSEMLIIVPALLLAVPYDTSPARIRIEWAVILLASLTISTSSSSYLFTLLILPTCLIWKSLQKKCNYLLVALLLILHASVGYIKVADHVGQGWAALLAVPRLYLLIIFCIFAYKLLIDERPTVSQDHALPAWIAVFLLVLSFDIATGLRHQRGLYDDYRWRVPYSKEISMIVSPRIEKEETAFIAMTSDGYHAARIKNGLVRLGTGTEDDLEVTAANGEQWIEQVGHESIIHSTGNVIEAIKNGESPVASFDGRWLAFLREEHGRARIWLRDLHQPVQIDRPLTSPKFNVLEISFLQSGGLIFSAVVKGIPNLFTVDQNGNIQYFDMNETRYPSASSDGRWLAYSRLEDGVWKLWIRNLYNGEMTRLTRAECNNTEPAWTADSQTLIYASDCGRGLWFSALCKRPIIHDSTSSVR